MNNTVYIILVNYNGFSDTVDCVESVRKIRNEYKIIIIDNASPDKSFLKLQEKFYDSSDIVLIQSATNLGFAGANNIGIKYAIDDGGELFLLLNNDTVVEPDFLDHMLKEYNYKSIVSPMIKYWEDKDICWYCAGHFNKLKCVVENGDKQYRGKVDFATGCCMLFGKNVIDRIGYINEDYFMYYEDVDFCLKAKEANIDIIYNPDAIIYHKVSRSSGGERSILSTYYNNRNRFYIIKNFHLGLATIFYTSATRVVRFVTCIFRKSNDYVIWEAFMDFTKNIKGPKKF